MVFFTLVPTGYQWSVGTNLRQLHRSKNNHQKIIVIGQIIGSGQIDSFMCIKSIIWSIHFSKIVIESNWIDELSIFNQKWTFFDMKWISYHFWIIKVLKTINNHLFTVLNSDGRLKHWIRIFFGRSTKNFTEKNL